MKEYTLVDAASAGVNVTSVSLDLGDLDRFSIHADFTGSNLAGTLALECSNDENDWIIVTDSSQAVTSAASHMWNVSGAAYKFVRVSWTYTSGAGNLTCKALIKENTIKPK